MAHLGPPDMRHAIGYALHWPDRGHVPVERLDLAQIGSLNFREADPVRYPALKLARFVMETSGLSGAAFNAAKEAALDAFIAEEIEFLDMAVMVERTLERLDGQGALKCDDLTLDKVLEMDHLARQIVKDAL